MVGVMKAWMVEGGALRGVELPRPEPREGEVLVRVRAFGVEAVDLHAAHVATNTAADTAADTVMNAATNTVRPGAECVGEVVAGAGRFAPGDRVAVVLSSYDAPASLGTWAEYVSVPAAHVFPIDSALPWDVFGALPRTFLTAYGVLFEAMETEEGQTIVVRGGGSALGMAAVAMLRELECRVYVSTHEPGKVEALERAGVHHVVLDDGGSVAAKVREREPLGVHGVVELVGTRETIADSLRCTRRKGFVGIVGAQVAELPRIPSTVRLTRYSSDALEAGFATPVLQNLVDKVEAGVYRAPLATTFGFAELPRAVDALSQAHSLGKVVVTLP